MSKNRPASARSRIIEPRTTETEILALRQATREAHEALADLRAEREALTAFRDKATADVLAAARAQSDVVGEVVTRELEEFRTTLTKVLDQVKADYMDTLAKMIELLNDREAEAREAKNSYLQALAALDKAGKPNGAASLALGTSFFPEAKR